MPTYRGKSFPNFLRCTVDLGREAFAVATIERGDHSAYDWNLINQHAPLIVDTRNAVKNVISPRARIILA